MFGLLITTSIFLVGGSSEPGKVTEVVDWSKDCRRGGVKILWKATKKEGRYRRGGEGVVDVIFEEPASVGKYFIEHLPVVGKMCTSVITCILSNPCRCIVT